MRDPRILVAGSAYIHSEGLRELCKLWTRVVQHMDPGIDIVILDSVSPFEPAVFLEWPQWMEGDSDSFNDKHHPHDRYVYRFKENIGHLSRGGEDGAGRTFCRSIELGVEGGYDYVAIIETDLIFLRSVTDICKRMQRSGTKIAAMPQIQYCFPEFGATFIDCKWAKEFNFSSKYDWKKSQPWPIPEVRIMNIVEDYLMLLPIWGMRNDHGHLNVGNLANYFPYAPCAWITHCEDYGLYLRAIQLNNVNLK